MGSRSRMADQVRWKVQISKVVCCLGYEQMMGGLDRVGGDHWT